LRKFLFLSTGVLFLAAAAALIIIGTEEKDNIMLILFSMSVPLIFTAYWNLFTVYYEAKTLTANEYFTYRSVSGAGIGAFYNRQTVIPMFLSLFTSSVLAIINSLVSNTKSEEIAVILLSLSFSACLVIAIVYTVKLNKSVNSEGDNENKSSNKDDAGFKIAFFFASIATLGLFPLGYYIYKALKKRT